MPNQSFPPEPSFPEQKKAKDSGKHSRSRLEGTGKIEPKPSLATDISSALHKVQNNDFQLSVKLPDSSPSSTQSPFLDESLVSAQNVPTYDASPALLSKPLSSSSAHLPLSSDSLILGQDISRVEHTLQIFRARRLEDYKQDVYIPPLAKPDLQAKGDAVFPLMETVQDFLAGDGQVMLILGDSGSGKSTFNRHLEHRLWWEYRSDGAIPLFINLPALDRPERDLVAEHLRKLDFPEEQIWDLKHSRRFVLICDGYDES